MIEDEFRQIRSHIRTLTKSLTPYIPEPYTPEQKEEIRKYLARRKAELRRKTKRIFPPQCCTIGQYIEAWDNLNNLKHTTYGPSFDPTRPWWPDGFNTETIDRVIEEHDHGL